MATEGKTQNESQSEWLSTRFWLAIGLTSVSVIGVIALSWVTISRSEADNTQLPMQVMTTVLPLIGTWVGTVLAYYFSKDNFEAATRSTAQLVQQLRSDDKLKSTPVWKVMLTLGNVLSKTLPGDDGKLLVDLVDEMEKKKKGSRLPILSDKKHPLYVVHRSVVERFLVKAARGAGDVKTLTLKTLLDDSDVKEFLKNSFATVREDANLAEAKGAMESNPNCQDVFVTKTGNRDEEVIGWITNVIIQENSIV